MTVEWLVSWTFVYVPVDSKHFASYDFAFVNDRAEQISSMFLSVCQDVHDRMTGLSVFVFLVRHAVVVPLAFRPWRCHVPSSTRVYKYDLYLLPGQLGEKVRTCTFLFAEQVLAQLDFFEVWEGNRGLRDPRPSLVKQLHEKVALLHPALGAVLAVFAQEHQLMFMSSLKTAVIEQ